LRDGAKGDALANKDVNLRPIATETADTTDAVAVEIDGGRGPEAKPSLGSSTSSEATAVQSTRVRLLLVLAALLALVVALVGIAAALLRERNSSRRSSDAEARGRQEPAKREIEGTRSKRNHHKGKHWVAVASEVDAE